MKKIFLIFLCLIASICSAQPSHYGPYDPGAARSNLSNVDATATPSMTSITLSDKIRAVWADILGDIYASGTVKVSTGTAAAPAYSFASDPDTGIYSAGANSIGFSIGGNVNTLSISGMTLADELDFTLSASNSGHSNRLQWAYGGTPYAWIERINADGGMGFTAQSLERMRITGSGNVLISTSTDDGANKLQVNGSMRLIGGAAPTATEGAIYFNSTDKHFYGYNGTAWVQLDN